MATANAASLEGSLAPVLGSWVLSVDNIAGEYAKNAGKPFPYVVIEDFFQESFARPLAEVFPKPDEAIWHRYHNPLEKKLACNDFAQLPAPIVQAVTFLNGPEVVSICSQIAGISHLESDPHLHGGGIHSHPRHGKLDMHLDYSIHPLLPHLERRLNLIVYLNRDWQPEYGGDIELWDAAFTHCVVKVPPLFNRAVLFQTSDLSYHGLPEPIKCPKGVTRNSLAVYYLAPKRDEATPRFKAQFFARPTDPPSELLDKLRAIRPNRRITDEDLPAGWDAGEKD